MSASRQKAYEQVLAEMAAQLEPYVEAAEREPEVLPLPPMDYSTFSDEDIQRSTAEYVAAQQRHIEEFSNKVFVPALERLSDLVQRAWRLSIKLPPEGIAAESQRCLERLGSGDYAVAVAAPPLNGLDAYPDELFLKAYAIAILGATPDGADELPLKILEVGPQRVVAGIALTSAISARDALNRMNWRAKVVELTGAELTGAARTGSTASRQPIPQAVRIEVWKRDEGRCVDCGSRERLEYDHIIPVSRGGANTARNLELRCENCNRRKGASI